MSGRPAKSGKLRRIQDLFTRGREVVLDPGGGQDRVTLWVAKPTAFEKDEAAKDGRAARAHRALAFDRDEREQAMVIAHLAEAGVDQVIDEILDTRGNEHFVKALDELRARKDWAERIEVMDREQVLAEDRTAGQEPDVLADVLREHAAEIDKLVAGYRSAGRAELLELDRAALDDAYRAMWREQVSFNAFMESRRISEFYYAIRDCAAVADGDGWCHDACDHRQRLCAERVEVHELPDVVLEAVRVALDELNMTPRDAGNSAAPTSSSASSERPNEAADSPPSIPTEM
jgi:hypothetical protein